MIIAIDTNILLDILLNDPTYYSTSSRLIEEYSHQGTLIICPLVYAEILTLFLKRHSDAMQLDEFLSNFGITVIGFSKEDTLVAAAAWQTRSRHKVTCPACGHEHEFSCEKCKQPLHWRNHILTDYFIGAHAQNRADILLTRDVAFYKKHFTVKVTKGL